MGTMLYNVNDTATGILAAKQIKENLFVGLLHKNGKALHEQTETDASTIRMMKYKPITADARELGATTNGGFFNADGAEISEVSEYDLNLLYFYDRMVDIPEVQQDMCPANLFDAANTNIGGRVATEINASTLAVQLKAVFDAVGAMSTPAWTDSAVVLAATPKYYDAFMDASVMLDNGDEANGIQTFPVEEREFLMLPEYRKGLMSQSGVLLGGSNFAQSMLAKGGVDPESRKENGSMYVGEIDMIPCYVYPKPIASRAKAWTDNATFMDGVKAIMCAAAATDRGISTPSYVKITDSPDGAGKRLQPKVRWGINVCYPKGIVPILANGTEAPTKGATLTVKAPGSKS